MNVMQTMWQRSGQWVGALAVAALLCGCGSAGSGKGSAQPAAGAGGALAGTNAVNVVDRLPLRVGDLVLVSFPDMVGDVGKIECRERIRDDGTVLLILSVKVHAEGKTVSQLQDAIHDAYVPKYYKSLTVSVKSEERFYYVGGEVRSPNRFPYTGEITVLRAIDSAGGFTDFANRKAIELRRSNGEFRTIDYNKAKKNPSLDLKVYPNDQIIVRQRVL